MDVGDAYRELGLRQDCSDAEIKSAWRRLAARWHPDRNDSPQALRKIQRINRALDEIRKARSAVAAGDDADEQDDEAPEDDAPNPASPDADDAAGDPGPGRTFDHVIELTLEEAAAGCIRDVAGEVVDDCAACGGHGVQARPQACTACAGSGRVQQPLWFPWMSLPAECSACAGQGELQLPCAACEGCGKAAPRPYRCRVRIPAGVREGDLLHAPTRARAKRGEARETLAIRVRLQPHPFFVLDADGTVKCEMPVDGFAWMAQRWIEVPTPAGPQQMRLRRGHLAYRIKGQGFPAERAGPRADCIVTVVPQFPDELSGEQEMLMDRLIASSSGAEGTAAAQRVGAWSKTVAAWKARHAGDAPAG